MNFIFGGHHTLEQGNNQLAFLKIEYQVTRTKALFNRVVLQVKLLEKRILHLENFQPKLLHFPNPEYLYTQLKSAADSFGQGWQEHALPLLKTVAEGGET